MIIYDHEYRLDQLSIEIKACQKCQLCKGRTNRVPGSGDPYAHLMFIAEAPGEVEEKTGVPLVGKAGQLFTRMIHTIGLSREEVYLTNVLKQRPPQNRDPETAELDACFPFLLKQIEIIQPRYICVMGRFAMNMIIGKKEAIGKCHGKWYMFQNIPIMPIYHPAFVLRNPAVEKEVLTDLKALEKKYRTFS